MDRENTPKFNRRKIQIPLYLLPRDFIEEEILSRLPVKSLLRFRCVSKSWRSLMDSKKFIRTHLRNSSKNTAFPHHRVILSCREGIQQCSLQSMLDPHTGPASSGDHIIDQFNDPTILGCCNGLVCILDVDKNFFLWNPSTRIFKKLPELCEISCSHGYIMNYGFGWDERSDDYKVFAFVHMLRTGAVRGKVYSSKTNTWKTVDRVYLPLTREEGIFVGGKLHWEGYGTIEANIACFDLKTEECGMIELPFKLENSFSYSVVGVIGGCLSSVKFYFDSPIEVWLMKEYGVEESWSRLAVLSHGQEPVERPFSLISCNGEVLLFFGRIFFVYGPQNYEFRRLNPFNSFTKENVYVESLIWPEFE